MTVKLSIGGLVREFAFYAPYGWERWIEANESSTQFAALWAQSASFGGQAHDGGNGDDFGPPVSFPPVQTSAMSYFHHHGALDTNVVPGGGPNGAPNRGAASQQAYEDNGLLLPQAQRYARTDLPALAAIQAYRDHNGANALTTNPNQPSINGSNTSTVQQWRRALGVDNPIVEYYSDPNMAHIGFANSPNRYFSVRDVWDWFKAHPRVS